MRIRPIFAWFDLWIGVYIDTKSKRVYLFPVPMFGIVVHYRAQPDHGKATP